MLKRMEFEHGEGAGHGAACAGWAALLPEAAEDLLGEAESRALALHLAGCPACEAELAEARRGAAWLTLLKGETPEPSHDLLAGILARTSGAPTLAETVAGELLPTPVPAWSVPLPQRTRPELVSELAGSETGSIQRWFARWFGLGSRHVPVLQPRLTMTAAMAFLSVCLTVNMLGISVTRLHAEDLHALRLPGTMVGKGASVLRSFQGIRAVYRVESRVNDWLAASTAMDAPASRQAASRQAASRQ